jgi:hypothetical protein
LPMSVRICLPCGSSMMRSPVAFDLNLYSMV